MIVYARQRKKKKFLKERKTKNRARKEMIKKRSSSIKHKFLLAGIVYRKYVHTPARR